jgi:hypothetical protein
MLRPDGLCRAVSRRIRNRLLPNVSGLSSFAICRHDVHTLQIAGVARSAPRQPDVFVFTVIVALNETTIKAGEAQILIQPGMTTEDENRRLKKLLAESMLDVSTLREAPHHPTSPLAASRAGRIT